MNWMIKLLVVSFSILFLFSGGAMADNITIYDGNSSSETGWYGTQEDQEVEPGMQTGQYWDLEGFFLDGSMLSMVGGFNFKTGRDGYTSGDIFIDIDGDAGGGIPAGDQIVTNSYGYEYAIRLDFDNSSYQVYALDDDSRTQVIHYTQNISSNPYKYIDGGDLISTQDNDFTYVTYNTDVFGLTGGDHNVISGIDLEFLGAGQDFWAHFTIECGNDNLMGAGTTPVPEPATMLLFGTGLIGLAGASRKKLFKS